MPCLKRVGGHKADIVSGSRFGIQVFQLEPEAAMIEAVVFLPDHDKNITSITPDC